MKFITLGLCLMAFSSVGHARQTLSVTVKPQIYQMLVRSRALLSAIQAYNLTYGFSPVKSIRYSTITLERIEGFAEDSYKVHSCEYSMTAELENGAKIPAVQESPGACR